jgi:hypothetical protein
VPPAQRCPAADAPRTRQWGLIIRQTPGVFQVSSQRRRQRESHELRQVEAESWLGRMPLRGARGCVRAHLVFRVPGCTPQIGVNFKPLCQLQRDTRVPNITTIGFSAQCRSCVCTTAFPFHGTVTRTTPILMVGLLLLNFFRAFCDNSPLTINLNRILVRCVLHHSVNFATNINCYSVRYRIMKYEAVN